MMTDTRTPADLGHKPSPTRAERDTWRPVLTVRPIRIAPGVREAVTAAYTHPMPFTSTFTDRNGVTWQDVVTCAQCSFSSTDLNLDMCPGDGARLGETSRAVTS